MLYSCQEVEKFVFQLTSFHDFEFAKCFSLREGVC